MQKELSKHRNKGVQQAKFTIRYLTESNGTLSIFNTVAEALEDTEKTLKLKGLSAFNIAFFEGQRDTYKKHLEQ